MFSLHPQLAKDTHILGSFPLSLLLIAKDANYPWCILVPKREGVREIHHLDEADQQQLLKESSALARGMESVFTPDKMNVAALGNMVSQLHIHHIARFKNDVAWPKPIWGLVPAKAYEPDLMESTIEQLRDALTLAEVDFNE